MNNASLELGGTNWAEKDGNILGYSVGDTSGKYSPQEFTFARGSNLSATRIDRAGLIVKGRENLVFYSQDFSNAAWIKSNVSITANQSDPIGGTSAFLVENQSTSGNYIYQNNAPDGCFSVYAKAGNRDSFSIISGTYGNGAYFDLSAETATSYGTGSLSVISSVGNNWYRCSVFVSTGVDFLITLSTINGGGDLVGDNMYFAFAQVELGTIASPYIESGATNGTAGVLENTPRLNYTTGVANPYLLLEPSRTNLIEQSEYFNSSYWIKSGSPTVSVSDNAGISPEGVSNATRFVAASAQQSTRLYTSVTWTAVPYTLSLYVKNNGGTNTNLRFSYYDGTGQYFSPTFTLTDEWQRIEYTFTPTASSGGFWIVNTPTGGLNLDLLAFGAQLEIGSYPTSYIPTYSVSATRAQDTCNKTNASGEIGQTEGTLFTEVDLNHTSVTNNYILQVSESSANRILLYKDATNKIGCFALIGSTAIYYKLTSGAFTGINKIAFAYKSGDFAFYVNGTQIGTSTATFSTSATFDRLDIDSNIVSENGFFNYNQVALYKERLTNAELATLTTI